MPAKAKNEIANPLPLLLRDDTLRTGDIVIFPDGPRVFTGEEGDNHALSDFVGASEVKLSRVIRNALASLVVGPNEAWKDGSDTQIAARDVETTGSARSGKRSRR